MEAEVN